MSKNGDDIFPPLTQAENARRFMREYDARMEAEELARSIPVGVVPRPTPGVRTPADPKIPLNMATPGYHVRDIPRGVYGELSKIYEEVEEIRDADEQGASLMVMLELADLYGAMRAYLTARGATMADLERMADITERAFRSGARSPK